MSVGIVEPLPDHCPWSELNNMAPPNINWCEENLCSWVVNPANTWSNLAFIVVGILFIAITRKQKTMGMFGPATIFVGVSSLLWHASFTFVFQFLDFLAMFAFVALPLILNLRRLELVTTKNQLAVFYSYVGGMSALLLLFYWQDINFQSLILVSIIATVSMELVLYKRGRESIQYKYLLLAVLTLGVGGGFSASDVSGVFCDPENHVIQGHAIWHILAATSLGFLFLFYRQFDFDEVNNEAV